MNWLKVAVFSAIAIAIMTVVVISAQDRNEKVQYLNETVYLIQNQGNKNSQVRDYIKVNKDLPTMLSKLARDNDEQVSAKALYVINIIALATTSISNSNSTFPNIRQSKEIRATLKQIITDDSTNDEIRGSAIDSYSWLYPPEDTMNNVYEKLIAEGGIHEGDTLHAIFGSYSKYKMLYDYEMPASIIKASIKLIDHPSGTVKSDALFVLRETVGKPALPVFFNALETTRTLGLVNIIIIDILSIDQTDDTILRLKDIASKSPSETGKTRMIEGYITPNNIKHFKKMHEINKRKK